MTRLAPLVLLLLVTSVRAQEATPRITSHGEAEIRVAPDEVIVRVGVEAFAVELAEAKQEADARMDRVLDSARALGVPDERLSTDYISVQPDYESSRLRIEGFMVRRDLEIRLRDLDRFEDLLTAVLDAGANRIQGVHFRTTELRRYRDEARDLALDAAREKATAMAARLGKRIGDPISINEGAARWWGGFNSMTQNVVQSAGPASSVDGPTSPGQIAVTATVTVVFELVD